MIFNNFANSIAYPLISSSLATIGIKDEVAIMAFSVGVNIPDNGYSTLDSDGNPAKVWIKNGVANFNDPLHIIYEAAAYEGGVGTTFATDPSRVTLLMM